MADSEEKAKRSVAVQRSRKNNYVRHTAIRMISSAKARARAAGVPCGELNAWALEERLVSNPFCSCCRTKLRIEFKGKRGPTPDSATLDRLRPELGYVTGNIAVLCCRCNTLKSNASSAELQKVVDWMKRIGL